MKTHQFKTNELGITYNEFATNLHNQLNNHYKLLAMGIPQKQEVFKKKTNAMISNNKSNINDGEE